MKHKGDSPTKRTLKYLRARGWIVDVTEHWNEFSRKRIDLFGFCDVLALKEGEGTLAVQCTSHSNMTARIKKITDRTIKQDGREAENPVRACALVWVQCCNRIEVWGWRQKKDSRFWEVVKREINLLDFEDSAELEDEQGTARIDEDAFTRTVDAVTSEKLKTVPRAS